MRKLLVYYLIILVPIPFIIWGGRMDAVLFALLGPSYVAFRVWFDRRRLIKKGVIGTDYGHFRFLIHGHIDFFRQLYLEP